MPVPGAVADPSAVETAEATTAASDGHFVPLYTARPAGDGESSLGLVVIPHGLGLDDHIRDLCRRFAAEGMLVAAGDLFDRVGGPPAAGDLAAVMARVNAMSDSGAVLDLRAAATWLRDQPACNGRVASIGFCMGGRLSLLLATVPGVLDRAIDCWGGRITRRSLPPDDKHPEVVLERIDRLCCPLLGVFGADDSDPSVEDVATLRAEMERHGKEHRIVVYRNAGHALLNDTPPSYAEAAAHQAWAEFLDFLAPLRADPVSPGGAR